MKIKNLLLVGIVMMLFVPHSFAKEKKTLLERVEEADSIPVYIQLEDIEYSPLQNTSGIPLNYRETKRQEVERNRKPMPKEFNGLVQNFVQQLNANFNTTKFYAAEKKLPLEPKNMMNESDPEAKLIVLASISMKYNYDNMTKVMRATDTTLALTLAMQGGFSCNFQLFNFESKSMKNIQKNGGMVYGEKFKIIDIPVDIATLVDAYDPILMLNKYPPVISERIAKVTEKIYKKASK